MASTSVSDQLMKWQEKQSVNQTVYKTKKIHFSGRDTPIILQNQNGPCPLIAICNVLLLRGTYELSVDVTRVPEGKLLVYVAERLYNALNKDANSGKTVADAIDLTPSLTTGMLVDVKFRRIHDFELTKENGVFGLLDIPLVHGWLVDPQDTETSKAIGSMSFNTLMEELVIHDFFENLQDSEAVFVKKSEEDNVEVEHLEKEDVFPTSANLDGVISESTSNVIEPSKKMKLETIAEYSSLTTENSDGVISEPSSNVVESSEWMKETIAEFCSLTAANSDGVISESTSNVIEPSKKMKLETIAEYSSLTTENSDGVISEPTSNVVESSEWMKETIAEFCSLTAANSDGVISEPTSNVVESSKKMKESVAESSSSALSSKLTEGELIKHFLDNNPTQLTVYGLFCLHEGLEEQELCVFFRNNHFNTMLKHLGELYILVTDEGYMDQPGVVWEKLTEVTGDTVFVDSNFNVFKPGNNEIEEIPESDLKSVKKEESNLKSVKKKVCFVDSNFNVFKPGNNEIEEIPESDLKSVEKKESNLKSVKKKDVATVMNEFEVYLEGIQGKSAFNPIVEQALELLGIDEKEFLYGPEVEEIHKSEEKSVNKKPNKKGQKTVIKMLEDHFEKLIKTQGNSRFRPNVQQALELLGLDEKDLFPHLFPDSPEVENAGPKPEAGNPGPQPEAENPGPQPETENPGPQPEMRNPGPQLTNQNKLERRRAQISSKKAKQIIKEKCDLM